MLKYTVIWAESGGDYLKNIVTLDSRWETYGWDEQCAALGADDPEDVTVIAVFWGELKKIAGVAEE